MNIILAMFSRNDNVLGITNTLKSMGHKVTIAYTDEYTQKCSYWEKKINKLGFHSRRNAYIKEWIASVHDMIMKNQAELLLFVNLPAYLLSVEDLQKLHDIITIKCWFVDGVSDHPEYIPYYSYIDNIYVFEESDISFLAKYKIKNVQYIPVGYNMNYHKLKVKSIELDVSFMGSPFKNRLQILEAVAIKEVKKNWKQKIMGPFYSTKYFWKKFIFEHKYPNITRFLENGSVTSGEVNKLYNNSRICLNIHDTKHKSLNPRSFDILAAGAFEIVDMRSGYVGDIQPGKALVEFKGIDDLLTKIEYYLANDEERETIAQYGYEHNIYSMEYSLRKVLD